MSERLPPGFVLDAPSSRIQGLKGWSNPSSDSGEDNRRSSGWKKAPENLVPTDLDSLLRGKSRSALQGMYGGGYNLPMHPDLLIKAKSRSEVPLRGAGSRKGTYFIGGAGLDGSYITDMVKALSDAGISNVSAPDRSSLSRGMLGDIISVPYYDDNREYDISKLDVLNEGPQFNIIGYSYGSLLAAQIADTYAKQGGNVDNLVLLGSPINKLYLDDLRRNLNIRRVMPVDLTEHGDPLYAGMSEIEAILSLPLLLRQMPKGDGHFYYAPDSDDGRKRRADFAQKMYNEGLR